MAKSLNLKTIAEGVENLDVLAILEDFGCNEVQGYHYAKPMEASEFERYFTSQLHTK
jgi:EAL domain-containing protein (putative c-di-GMP-specific phosphodiesterase class I)